MARFASVVLVLSALGYTVYHGVRADLYGYVDPTGRAHVSDKALTPEYKLFSHGEPKAKATLPAARATKEITALPASELRPISKSERKKFSPLVIRAAKRYNIDPALIHAVISAESAYDQWAVSPRGAQGLMQLMPAVAEQYGVDDVYDPQQNVFAGARHLRYLMREFDNDIELVLAAYNAGHNNVLKYGRAIPPFRETRNYVPKVLGYYRKYQAEI